MKKLITKNSCLIFFFLASTNFLFGQVTNKSLPRLKINLNAGITYTRFYGKQPFILFRCIDGCPALEQTTKPAFAYGATVTKLVGSRHYFGGGYNYYQIKLDQVLIDGFTRGAFERGVTLNYHSWYVLHQYLIQPNKSNLFWNNSIGVDLIDANYHTNNRSIFYRTGLEYGFYLGNFKLTLNPYLQIGLTPYSKKIQGSAMRPYSFGLNVQIPLDFLIKSKVF